MRLKVMEAQGADERRRLEFARPYIHRRDIRMIFVEGRRTEGDLGGAISLLLEGRTRADGALDETVFAEELAELYEETGQLDLACAEMRTLAVGERRFNGKGTYWFEKLKSLTPVGEWFALRDELLARMTDSHYRRSCLAIEGLYNELMNSVEGEDPNKWYGGKLWEVRRFRKELGPLFPERVASIYRKGVESELAGYGTNRKTYQEAVRLMQEMAEADPKAAADLAKWIRETYPRRRALMDELYKAGW